MRAVSIYFSNVCSIITLQNSIPSFVRSYLFAVYLQKLSVSETALCHSEGDSE